MLSFRMPTRRFLFSLPLGSDIHERVTAFCVENKVRKGWISIIGAVDEAKLGYYDQARHRYHDRVFKEDLEIVSCQGNVSLKEGKPFLHLHAALGDTELRTWSGHLFPGSRVFAAEVCIQEVGGAPLARLPDASTGLALWKCKPL
ncbi:MAG: DNA-binding protein [Elusimicrobia bacterium]|nr:DNA-binding protein [Elusimicrobiota bacterium]